MFWFEVETFFRTLPDVLGPLASEAKFWDLCLS